MSNSNIAIIDYQMGNLRSVQKGFEKHGHSPTIISEPEQIAKADKIVLPGVGAFGDAMAELQKRHLIEPICDTINSGKPFLGICLGLHLLFDVGSEGEEQPGLGILPGKVVRFDVPPDYKVPHMGWNQLQIRRQSPLLNDIAPNTHFYFVHSYYVVPTDAEVIATETDYHRPFCSMVWRDNLYATQFHPEKSQADGLTILKNFAEL